MTVTLAQPYGVERCRGCWEPITHFGGIWFQVAGGQSCRGAYGGSHEPVRDDQVIDGTRLSRDQRAGKACAYCCKRWPRPRLRIGVIPGGMPVYACAGCASAEPAAAAVDFRRVAAALAEARGLIAAAGLSYEAWFIRIGPDVDLTACPMDPVCAIVVAAAGEPHGLTDDDLRLEADCATCAVIAAAVIAFGRHVAVTEQLFEDGQMPRRLTATAAVQLIISWIEADVPPTSVVQEALIATAAEIRTTKGTPE